MALRWKLQPARFPEIREQELALYRATSAVYRRWCEHVWQFLPVPGKGIGLAADITTWPPEQQAAFDQAVRWFIDSMVGQGRDPAAFSDPSTAYIDLHNPIYDGAPILPGQLRTSYEVGIGRAVQLVGAEGPALLGARNYQAQQEFLKIAFDRLSDGARIKLADVLNGDPEQGESVKGMILRSLNEGQSPLKTEKQLRAKFREIEGYNWQRLARTETSIAQNAGLRDEYLERGYRIPAGVELPSYHPHCLLPGTRVAAENVVGALRARYDGPAVELTLSDGSVLATTANHLILTADGFARAEAVHKGCYVVCASGSERVGVADPHDDQLPPLVENVVGALFEAHGMATAAVPLAAEDIHGDGRFVDGKVDVVAADGFLARAYEPTLIEKLLDLHFEGGAANVLALASSGYTTPMLFALALTTDCRVSRPDHPLSRLGAHVVRDKLLSLLAGSGRHTCLAEQTCNDAATDAIGVREVLAAFSGHVGCYDVVSVRHFQFCGHVYDLQTFSSLYIANGVLTSNCVCSTTILPDLGLIVPDVAATACEKCQAAKSRAEYIVARLSGVQSVSFVPQPIVPR